MRPIVVIVHSCHREILRENGELPDSWFADFDDDGRLNVTEEGRPAVLIWPHTIKYNVKAQTETGSSPVGLLELLGYESAESDTDDKKRTNEVFSSFSCSTVVHVVIAAKNEGCLTSAIALANWEKLFRESFKSRFNFQCESKSVLVLVASGERIRTNSKELEDFNSAIESSEFACCYIVDHNLYEVHDGNKPGDLFESGDVWDILVSRLLLNMALSQEDEHAKGKILSGKIRAWRAYEGRRISGCTNCAEHIGAVLDGVIADGEKGSAKIFGAFDLPSPEIPAASRDKNAAVAGLKWQDLTAENLRSVVAECAGGNSAVPRGTERFRTASYNLGVEDRGRLSNWIQEHVHAKLRREYAETVEGARDEEKDKFISSLTIEESSDCKESIEQTLLRALEKEQCRQDALRGLHVDSNVGDFNQVRVHEENFPAALLLAQAHYVGFKWGASAVLAFSILGGIVLSRIVYVFGGTLLFAMILSALFAVGGFAMLSFILSRQNDSGENGVSSLKERLLKANKGYEERNSLLQKILLKAKERQCHLSRFVLLARFSRQLRRLDKLIEGFAPKYPLSHETGDSTLEHDGNADRSLFLDGTTFDLLCDNATKEMHPEEIHGRLCDTWKDWCDKSVANVGGKEIATGYFPVCFFSKSIRDYVVQETSKATRSSPRSNQGSDALIKCFEKCKCMKIGSFLSARLVSDQPGMFPETLTTDMSHAFYVPVSSDGNGPDCLAMDVNRKHPDYNIIASKLITETKATAFFFHELPVKLDVDNEFLVMRRR